MDLRHFVHSPAVTCRADTTLADVAKLMETNDVGSVVVVGEVDVPVGIVTDRDLAIRGMARLREPGTPVEEVMTRRVIIVREDADVFAAATEMATSGCRRLPVIDSEGRLVGVVAFDDLLTLFAHQTDKLAEAVSTAIPRAAMPQ
jgi:signal-transduction protein with cAMP-binding, CBS, and nucleotidyltransferase domain